MHYTAIRPTLSDFVFKMPRGAQVIYPKDLGAILLLADIFPGARVLESGVGSGALSMTMLRAGRRHRRLRAARGLRRPGPEERAPPSSGDEVLDRYRVEQRDCYDGIDETDLDRVVLDLPEPWQVVKHAARALHPGGLIVAYTPQITQAVQLREALERERVRHGGDDRGAPPRAGTSRASPSGPTTGWWPTPGSSPTPDCSGHPDADRP